MDLGTEIPTYKFTQWFCILTRIWEHKILKSLLRVKFLSLFPTVNVLPNQ
jgi:hypothetical protein